MRAAVREAKEKRLRDELKDSLGGDSCKEIEESIAEDRLLDVRHVFSGELVHSQPSATQEESAGAANESEELTKVVSSDESADDAWEDTSDDGLEDDDSQNHDGSGLDATVQEEIEEDSCTTTAEEAAVPRPEESLSEQRSSIAANDSICQAELAPQPEIRVRPRL